jgi:serine/threonine-protein kinase
MAQNNDRSAHDLDDDTWYHTDQRHSTISPAISSCPMDPGSGSTEEPLLRGRGTVAGAETTPPPFDTSAAKDSKDSADSDGITPTPGGERTDEWDLLPAPTIKEGETVFGKYLLKEKIGEGGMGEVWRVENVRLERESALKLVKPEYAQNDKGWKRFQREARLMAKITHPHLVAIYDYRRSQSMGYIEMEFVRGRSLEKYLKDQKKPMSPEWTAQLLDQLCSVLHEAHGYVDRKSGKAKPIIHRDLKPSNLMLVDGKPDGENLKVLDLGVAKMVQDEGNPELTGQGDFVGTPYYMSPEQIEGGAGKDGRGQLDGRSDLYSVGVLLYQLLTGVLPFTGRNNMSVLMAHLYKTPPPMSEANPRVKVPPRVERLVMSCLERDPDLRPSTAGELAEKFRAAIADLPPSRPKARPRKAYTPGVLAIALLVVAALTVGGLVAYKSRLRNPIFDPTKTEIAESDRTKQSDESPPGEIKNSGEPAHRGAWPFPGYESLDSEQLKAIVLERGKEFAPGKPTTDLGEAPAGLRHRQDHDVYYGFAPGVYLPLGYLPADPAELINSWPKALVRVSDGVRFIRITGGRYMIGDFRAANPVDDARGNAIQAHDVRVSSFYIQEAEVTNKEIKEFQKDFSSGFSWEEWKKACGFLHGTLKVEDDDYPAVCVDRATAQKYARWVGGRLPTEAEWEYAARSGGQNRRWACSSAIAAKKRSPKAHLSSSFTDPPLFPRPVKSFTEDQTDQRVFDMTGNVQEWCLDVYRPYVEIIAANQNPGQPLLDPRVGVEPDSAESKAEYVVRGGSYYVTANDAMVFQRAAVAANSQLNHLGFRVVIPCPPEPGEPGE